MNGLEFLRELRSDTNIKQIPVVVFTTSRKQRDLIETYGFNVAGYMLKPPTFEKFMEVLVTLNIYWRSCEMV